MARFAAADPETAALFKAAAKVIPASPLAVPYFSTVPFKLGDGAVKYVARPTNYLGGAMAAQLSGRRQPAVFDLCVVPQTDPAKTPVEDPTKPWPGPQIPVATITIPPQDFNTPERCGCARSWTSTRGSRWPTTARSAGSTGRGWRCTRRAAARR